MSAGTVTTVNIESDIVNIELLTYIASHQYIHENLCDAGCAFGCHTVRPTCVNKPLDDVVIATVVNVLPGKYVA